jgi:inner membrane protein
MASAFTHAFVGAVIGKVIEGPKKMPWRFWVGLALCSALPDLDVIGMGLGIPYANPYGHRGFTHSLVFAAFLGWVVMELMVLGVKRFSKAWWVLWVCFFLATASHGFLDAFTNGGQGVAFFWPFDNTRYFFTWRPISVSPLSVHRFFDGRAFTILKNEFIWIWLPTIGLYLASKFLRKRS